MNFFDIFRRKQKTASNNSITKIEGPSIFYHEDDFRQVEIVPNENYNILKAQSDNVQNHTKKSFDGYGYSGMYIRTDDNKLKLSNRQIQPQDLEPILSTLGLERISNVLTGYGQSYREVHKNCVAFGKNYSAIYYDYENNIVQHIWVTSYWDIDEEKLINCLHHMGKKWNLLLQDWNLLITVDLKNRDAICDYFRTHQQD